jgi:aspartate/methionine/tyrosine aminotransferase
LQLSVAENQMLEDLLVPALTEFSSQPFTADLIYYQPTHGRLGLREAVARYLERLLNVAPQKIDPEGLVMGAGCNAVLENLCMCLADPGEAVMIPTPYYAAFEFDLSARAGLEIVPVKTFATGDSCNAVRPPVGSPGLTIPAEAYYPRKSTLDAAYRRALESGTKPRILLLSHPSNPLGICYPPEIVQECIDWCREHRVHLISDEIYAGSVFGADNVFTSVLELCGDELGNYVHLVYALSKDFGLSGLRVGAAYSENPFIRTPFQKLNDLCQISSQTQVMVEAMLTAKENDEYWTDAFLRENHARIRSRCHKLQTCLEQCDISFLEAESGLFLWMDFTQFLPPLDPAQVIDGEESLESMQERERALYLELMHTFGLLFTPGLSMRNERPGFFRCVFTAASDDEFALSLDRIRAFLQAKKER